MRRMLYYVSSRHSRNDDQTNSCGFSSISKVDGVRAALAPNFLHRFGISERAAWRERWRVGARVSEGPCCLLSPAPAPTVQRTRVARFASVQRKLLEIKLMSSSINRSLKRERETANRTSCRPKFAFHITRRERWKSNVQCAIRASNFSRLDYY